MLATPALPVRVGHNGQPEDSSVLGRAVAPGTLRLRQAEVTRGSGDKEWGEREQEK